MYLKEFVVRNAVWHVFSKKCDWTVCESNGVRRISQSFVIVCLSESNSVRSTGFLRAYVPVWHSPLLDILQVDRKSPKLQKLTQIKFVPRDAGVRGGVGPLIDQMCHQ